MQLFDMANLQRLAVSVLLILTFTFLFMGQTAQAVKGPKITHKASSIALRTGCCEC